LALFESEKDIKIRHLKQAAIKRFAESNIPVEYWHLSMKNFQGGIRLLEKYNEYVEDLSSIYTNGTSFCLAGSHGLGKTMISTCILQATSLKGYSSLYTTLSDLVSVLTQASNEEKFIARRELCMVDFLVIDEFDSRFMSTTSSADLFARMLENVFRSRIQNKLPTIMCTNSPNILEAFTDSLKASLGSLMSGYLPVIAVFGQDFRKNK